MPTGIVSFKRGCASPEELATGTALRKSRAIAVTLPGIIQNYIDAYNRKDVAALVACVTDDVVFENVSKSGHSVKIDGRTAFAKLAEHAATMFTTRHQTISNAVVDGSGVAFEVDWTGILATDLGPMKAGEPVAMRGASFITIADGKLTRIVDLS